MKTLRTPDERFTGLPGFDFAPNYHEIADTEGGKLRVHYLREGDPDRPGGPAHARRALVVLPLPQDDPGPHRGRTQVVAPDLVGFGRSDKPSERSDYTFARHVEWMRDLLFDQLRLPDVTLVGQDWGGLIGLRLVGEHPERFARVVAANTFLPTGDTDPGEAFFAWQRFSQEVDEFPTGVIVKGGCVTEISDEVRAAYDAPFPDETFKSGARQFPMLVPSRPDDPAHDANVAAWVGLAAFDRPFLCAFSDSDPITKGADRNLKERIAGAQGQPHTTIVGGGHFLQEDRGEELARVVVDFVAATS